VRSAPRLAETERDPVEKTSDIQQRLGDEMLKLRRRIFAEQIYALAARVRMLKGEKLKFDDEFRVALYGTPLRQRSGFALRES